VETGLHETAQQWFRTILKTKSEHEEAIVGLAASLRAGGSEPEAEKLLLEKIGTNAHPGPRVLNALAWLRATAKTDSLRNGAQAEQMARQAAGALQEQNFLVQRTLAAALAEQGKFQDAAKIAEDAVGIANAAGRQSDADEIRIQLESYRANKPFRAER
jgi:tetratricopeptide (TPR) repeat protein